jgi:transposase
MEAVDVGVEGKGEAGEAGLGEAEGAKQVDTVTATSADTEDGVIGQGQWEAIHGRHAQGQTISAIARDLDLDRKTVRSVLRQRTWQRYSRLARKREIDAHLEWLRQRAPEVSYSARILHQELTRQRGFTGCYESVKVEVRPLRAEASAAGLTQQRFETVAGEQAQVDWGQWKVRFNGHPAVVHVLVMTLGYSRRAYCEGFLNERIGNVLAAHEHAFAHFGGRCETLLYDRMRTVVIGTEGERPRLNATFQAFAQYWGFTPRLCRPYRAKTKGKVESGVKYLKRNFAPGRTFRDLEDFNEQLVAWQANIADVRVHGTTHQRPIDRFVQEAAALVPTSNQPSFLQAMVRERVVAEDWLVSIDANRYSVPYTLVGKTVQVIREGCQWVIRHRGQIVAVHEITPGRAQIRMDMGHSPMAGRQRQADSGTRRNLEPLGNLEVEVRDLVIYEQIAELMEAS